MSSTSNKNANEGTLTQTEGKSPYLNPDGSTNEDKLVEDLKAYQGESSPLVAASLVVRINENPEPADDEREFIKLYRRFPESARPVVWAMIVLCAGQGTPADRETLRLWIEQQDQRGRSILPELRELVEEHT